MARILLGVTGGIAAYKALEFARLAIKAGHAVRVIQTEASTRFVGVQSFAAVTGAPVLVTEWETDALRGAFPGDPPPEHAALSHLELVRRADVFLIAPASANTLAKLAAGIADNLLTAAALACRTPLLVAPAMNHAMYEHPATRDNFRVLRERGTEVLDSGTGALGSLGEWGIGRLREPADLLAAVQRRLASSTPGGEEGQTALGEAPRTAPGQQHQTAPGENPQTAPDEEHQTAPGENPQTAPDVDHDGCRAHQPTPGDLDRLRVLVTAGGTREPIDAVRYVGNRSSGRMGWALADEASRRGARVQVVAAGVGLERRPGVEYVDVESAEQLAAACRERFAACDVLLMAAAVADFRPAAPQPGKIKKDSRRDGLTMLLEPTEDIIAGLAARRRPDQVLVGFAAEHGPGAIAQGRAKLDRKGLDAVVVNDVSVPGIGFDAVDNEVTIITGAQETHVARATKAEVARRVLDAVVVLRRPSGPEASAQQLGDARPALARAHA